MSSKKRRKKKSSRVSIMFVPETGGKVRTIRSSSNAIARMIVTVIALLAILICYCIFTAQIVRDAYDNRSAGNAKLQIVVDENTSLRNENAELSAAVNDLNDELAAKEKEAQLEEVTRSEQAVPKGFPLDGSAVLATQQTIQTTEETNPEDANKVAFMTNIGTAVMATGSGTIAAIEDDPVYGHVLRIDHGNGYETIYYTSATIRVEQGVQVNKGDVIGIMTTEGELLTYAVKLDGQFIDPMSMMEIAG